MVNFQDELLRRFRLIDGSMPVPPTEEKKKVPERYYNVHKRSLPPGLDRIVVMGVTKEEGDWLVTKYLKAKVYTNDADDSKTLVYFDLIPEDATARERSIYFNVAPCVNS